MGLGPSLSIRQSQQLVLTPQLQQAIQLLAAQQPRARSVHRRGAVEEPAARSALGGSRTSSRPAISSPMRATATRRRTIPGADDLIIGPGRRRPAARHRLAVRSARDRQLFRRRDVRRRRGSASISTGFEYSAASLAEHLLDQLHGASGDVGDLARIIAETLDETGYLTVPLEQIAELTGAPLAAGRAGARRSSRASIRPASARARSPNASRCRRRPPTATIRRWRG